MELSEPVSRPETRDSGRAWIPYVVPMVLFVGLTSVEGRFADRYVWFYIAKVVVVTLALIGCRAAWKDIRFDSRVLAPALLVGIFVFAEWILVDRWTPHFAFLGGRAAYDPFSAIADPAQRGFFIAVRLYGLALMVPVMEELFWRSFLIRWITETEFKRVPIGTFSASAFTAVAFGFGFEHPEWLAALGCAVAYGLLLKQTKSVFACVVAHAITNLALGVYVLTTHQWRYW